MTNKFIGKTSSVRQAFGFLSASFLVFSLFFGFTLPIPFAGDGAAQNSFSFTPSVNAGSAYTSVANSNFNLTLTADLASASLIDTNHDWSGIASVEGYRGEGLSVEGTDPQTVTGTEATLPSLADTYIQANKGNTSAVNNGGLAEFDRAPDALDICYGFQGNVQADNPYMIFYINTTGVSNPINVSYRVRDVDAGNNSSVSPIALQYRVGTTGPFINVPAGYIADATQGPNIKGLVTTRNVALPAAVNNQPQVQIRLITTNAVGPDEWIGVNNIVIGPFAPTAGSATIGGRIYSPYGKPLSSAQVTMYDNTGNARTAISNAFGFYHFEGVTVGETYIMEVRSKRFTFNEPIRAISVQEDTDSIDFYAAPGSLPNPISPVSRSK